MIKVGMTIGDRYEILEKIGTGGMSDVYKARCQKLNRFVAVKVLKQEFSENANFVSKFQVEAQAAAGLAHPNIVNVYDVGEDKGIYYIVMELVEGITLKRYIEKKGMLSYKEAVSIAIQMSMGIEAAHNNHIIHRDIKPQNIIISRDGKVKVTDFGIAKAATSNTITSNVMGSVHYTSPEQARGGYSDAKSDIYSLGISLYEMLTGRVPFAGDTTVAIAIKHIQEEMPSPRELVEEIPVSVESIIKKCCQKSPDRRYQNMHEVIVDLKRCLVNPEQAVAADAAEVGQATRDISEVDVIRIKKKATKRSEHSEEDVRLRKRSREDDDFDRDDKDEYDYDPKMERLTTILAVFVGIVICGIVVFLLLRVFDVFENDEEKKPTNPIISVEESSSSSEESSGSQEAEQVKMLSVVGWNMDDAKMILERRDLVVRIEYEESMDFDKGMVIRTDKESGEMLDVGSMVIMTVSSGSPGVEAPPLVGKTREDALKVLENMDLEVVWEETMSATVTAGVVISQDPVSGTIIEEGGTLRVVVSRGADTNAIKVPDVIGKTEAEGIKMMQDAGLTVSSISHVNSSRIPAGQICYQSYSAGSYVKKFTVLELHISIGPAYYSYSGTITAPSALEAPDYVAGTPVQVTIVTDEDVEIYSSTLTSFPQPVNFVNVTSAGATVTLSYSVTDSEGAVTQNSIVRRIGLTRQ